MEELALTHKLLVQTHRQHDVHLDNPSKIPINHVLHVLSALYHLGAPATVLQRWYDTYMEIGSGYGPPVPHLQSALGPVTESNFDQMLGKKGTWKAWTQFFDQKLDDEGTGILNRYLSEKSLLPSLIDDLFHGPIAIGLGLELGSKALISSGLSQLAMFHSRKRHTLPASRLDQMNSQPRTEKLSLRQIISSLREDSRVANTKAVGREAMHYLLSPTEDLFSKRETSPLASAILEHEALYVPDLSTDEARETACMQLLELTHSLFRASGCRDFVLLHTFTMAWSSRFIIKHLSVANATSYLRYFWAYVLLAYIARGKHDVTDGDTRIFSKDKQFVRQPSWWLIRQRAFGHNDEHTVKVVYVAWKMSELVSPLVEWRYRDTAQAVLDVVDPTTSKKQPGSVGDWVYPTMAPRQPKL
eukprot:TRINITY_DN115299_c0_g1_i1.p1 TRINITY_DN115299_c0_g1~~TRINITY_DN115299_c0_g1_i1.p1  ORF type:complete len:415 (-),score=10.81 TRINITY_DN115299_c0_g1_i1:471-1715(-)